MAIKLNSVECQFWNNAATTKVGNMKCNAITCGGLITEGEGPHYPLCRYLGVHSFEEMARRSREGTAVCTLMFLTALSIVGVGAMAFSRSRNPYRVR